MYTTRGAWTPDELNYGRRYWGRTDKVEREEVVEMWRANERAEPSGKHAVVKRSDKGKRATSAAPKTGTKPEDASVSPPLKAMKFEKYNDDVPR